jgi:hypothetical protein
MFGKREDTSAKTKKQAREQCYKVRAEARAEASEGRDGALGRQRRRRRRRRDRRRRAASTRSVRRRPNENDPRSPLQ